MNVFSILHTPLKSQFWTSKKKQIGTDIWSSWSQTFCIFNLMCVLYNLIVLYSNNGKPKIKEEKKKSPTALHGSWFLSQVVNEQDSGYTLDRSPVHHSNTHVHIHTLLRSNLCRTVKPTHGRGKHEKSSPRNQTHNFFAIDLCLAAHCGKHF